MPGTHEVEQPVECWDWQPAAGADTVHGAAAGDGDNHPRLGLGWLLVLGHDDLHMSEMVNVPPTYPMPATSSLDIMRNVLTVAASTIPPRV